MTRIFGSEFHSNIVLGKSPATSHLFNIYVGGKTWTQQNQAQQDLNIV